MLPIKTKKFNVKYVIFCFASTLFPFSAYSLDPQGFPNIKASFNQYSQQEPIDDPSRSVAYNRSYGFALESYGSPQSKIEFETSRKEIWTYKNRELTFVNGILVSDSLETNQDLNRGSVHETLNVKPFADPERGMANDTSRDSLNLPIRSVFEAVEKENALGLTPGNPSQNGGMIPPPNEMQPPPL
jgi:hypothetical protein